MAEQFSRRQVEMILRRTAELERRDDDLDTTSPADLEKVAAELGMSQDALKQALAESRAGLLAPAEEAGFFDRVYGGAVVEVRRHVPGQLDWVRTAVERFLQNQGFQLKRNRGDTTIWEPARDLWTKIRRAFRAGPYRLPREVDVEVHIAEVPGGKHPVLVRLRADARRLRSSCVGSTAAALVVGAGIAVAGAVMLPMPTELALWAGGAAVGAAGAYGGRASYRNARASLETALERFLDFLEHEPAQAAPAHKDPWSRIVDFLADDWWR